MSNETNNETRFEQVGDKQVTFEKMNNTWYVNSNEIARVFGKSNHGQMITHMKDVHGDSWDKYFSLHNIVKRDYADGRGKTNEITALLEIEERQYLQQRRKNNGYN